MSAAIAVLDSGPSAIAFSVHDMATLEVRARGQVESIHAAPRFAARNAVDTPIEEKAWPAGSKLGHDGALDHIVSFARRALPDMPLVAVGHRVAHGGLFFDGAVPVDGKTLAQLETLVSLAPRRQPHNLAPIQRLLQRAPSLPQVACFDTAFHRTQPEVAQMLALPRAIRDLGVRRFGFHGLSYECIADQMPALDPKAARGRTIVLHLGNCASMCALQDCRSVATTMGFTALDGLMTGTRCGSIDPGAMLYLMQTRGMDARAIEKLLYEESGLLGVSGISPDMRTLLASQELSAQVAVDLYVYRIRREMGSLAAALGGVDALVFTGTLGENSCEIRARVCRDASWLGVEINPAANAARARKVSAPTSRVTVWRVPADEVGVIARHTREITWERARVAGEARA